MGWISIVFVHKAIEAATIPCDAARLRQALYRSVGIDPRTPVDPKQMIQDDVFFGLLERIASETDDGHAIPVRIGASMRCDDYGAFGLAFKSAPDLLGSYRRVERYGKVVTSVANFRLKATRKTARLEIVPAEETRLGLTMTNELAISAAISLSREVNTQEFAPTRVYFMHSAPKVTQEQMNHFKCPIHYGSDCDGLEVKVKDLQFSNRLGDTGISAFFDEHLDQELEGLVDPTSLAHRVSDVVGDALSEGVPTLSYVAERLGMSNRTLQRRLAEAGFAYQDLVSDKRQRLAEQLLSKTDYAVAEIAFLTGFSDQSTFTRAFKRWSGRTPAHYRRTG